MINAFQCIRSTVRLVPVKLNYSYPLSIVNMLSQSHRMSSTHTHEQLAHKPKHLNQKQQHQKEEEHQHQQQPQSKPSKHEQQMDLNHKHVSVFVVYSNEVGSN